MSVKMVNTVHQLKVLPASQPPPQWGLLTYERAPWETLGFNSGYYMHMFFERKLTKTSARFVTF